MGAAIARPLRALGVAALLAHALPAGAGELAARYRVSLVAPDASGRPVVRTQDWTLWRAPDRIAWAKGGRTEDLWRRDARGNVRLERVFRSERRVVHYAAGQLRAMGVEADWSALGTPLDARDLATLERVAQDGARARYRGVLRGERVELTWDERLALPVALRRAEASGREVRFELVESHVQPPADWPRPGADTADYARLDAADFGDLAHDEFVRQVEARDARAGWRSIR
ncbi:MAG TPA: hypothetical protein VFZ93_14780 [Albitalea sp.]